MSPIATHHPSPGWIDYDTHARTRRRDDLWGQVRRTVRGQPVADSDIAMIVGAIRRHLALEPGAVLLDLACGNGALTARLHPHVSASLGVDISGYLIDIARERFASARHGFLQQDAADYAETASDPARFTTALCYGSLPYLDDGAARRLFRALHNRFPAVQRVMLGNLPDPSRTESFYTGPRPDLQQPRSDIGVWRSPARLANLAGAGWRLETSIMPPAFFAAHYRYDALLLRAS